MDKMIEINFINKYIISEKKDRLIYEFSNLKKEKMLYYDFLISLKASSLA